MDVEAGKDVFPQLCSTLFFEIGSLMKPGKGNRGYLSAACKPSLELLTEQLESQALITLKSPHQHG